MKPEKLCDGVIAAAYNVGPDYVDVFLRTFRAVNASARIILLVNDDRKLAPVTDKYGVELEVNRWISRLMPMIRLERKKQTVRISELIGRTNNIVPRFAKLMPEPMVELFVAIVLARHFHTLRVLRKNTFNKILLSDTRDVLFQADPFVGDAPVELAQEDLIFGSCAFNDKWMRGALGDQTLNQLRGKPVYCVGTILGHQQPITELLTRMCAMVRNCQSWRPFGVEQAIFNYLIHTEMTPDQYAISTNKAGRMATLGPNPTLTVSDGCIRDQDGRPFPVVHQYDRLMSIEVCELLKTV
jgi:hypothetical protein